VNTQLSFTMTKWQYHLLAISIFYLVSLPIFVNSQQCPAFDENGECKLKCQCTDEPGKCLRDEQFCDGVFDCQDGQDEEDCCSNCGEAGFSCPADEFKCECDCKCYPMSIVCDGVKQCSDGADENADCPAGTQWWIWLIVALVISVTIVILGGIAYLIIKHQKKKDKYVVEGAKPYKRGKDNSAFSNMNQPTL